VQVALAFGRRGVEKLVDVLAADVTTTEEKNRALVLIADELSTQEKKALAIRMGAVAAATALLSSPHAPTRANAALVLSRACTILQGRAAAREAGSVLPLTQACRDDDETVRRNGAVALATLAFFRDGWDVVVKGAGVISDLVRCLPRNHHAVLVFVNVSAFYAEVRRRGCAATLRTACETVFVAEILRWNGVRGDTENERGPHARQSPSSCVF
jgi:hypothetical protein